MITLTLIATAVALGACWVAWVNWQALAEMQRSRDLIRKSRDLNRTWAWGLFRLAEQAEESTARRSRAGKIARQAQIDRQRALRDNATAALREGRAI